MHRNVNNHLNTIHACTFVYWGMRWHENYNSNYINLIVYGVISLIVLPVLGPGFSSISPDKMRSKRNKTREKVRLPPPSSPDHIDSTHPKISVVVPFLVVYDVWWQYHNPILTLHCVVSIMVRLKDNNNIYNKRFGQNVATRDYQWINILLRFITKLLSVSKYQYFIYISQKITGEVESNVQKSCPHGVHPLYYHIR